MTENFDSAVGEVRWDRPGEPGRPPAVLVCWGTDDGWIPVERGHELASLIPGAQPRLIEGAGRLVQEDTPAGLTGAVLEFLYGLPGQHEPS